MRQKTYDVEIELVSQRKKCHRDHRKGDRWVVGGTTSGGICMGAFSSLLPYITALRFGGSFPWEETAGEGTFCCPDSEMVTTSALNGWNGAEAPEPPG